MPAMTMSPNSIDANDLEIINGTEEDQVFYEVLQRFDARYGTVYEINLCGMSGIGSSKIVLSSCVCKLDGTIVEGDLFAGRESLSKRELSLIKRGIQRKQIYPEARIRYRRQSAPHPCFYLLECERSNIR